MITIAAAFCACGPARDETGPLAIHAIPLASAPGSAQPNLAAGSSGELVLSWQEPDGDATALRFSAFDGRRWSEPRTVATGDRWFVNWADFPSVVPISEDFWAAHWLAKREGGTYAYDVAVAVSRDAGATWTEAITPHDDGTATEHGFVSLFPVDGKAGALWLDGRNTSPDGGHEHHGDGAMTLRSATIDRELGIASQMLADDRVCDCCQTDVAIAGRTPVAVYRNRSDEEIRDIYSSRLEASGWTEGTPIARDGWEIAGCPVNGPAIDARGESVVVAWFTAANEQPRVRFVVSADGGRTFGEPVEIAAGATLGRVDVVLLDDGSAVVSHLENAGDGMANVVLRTVGADGTLDAPVTAASTAAGRMSGFPQLARHGDGLVLAWTDIVGDESRVRSATVTLPGSL